eukprot:4260351-Pleurochrysis_carterae.AAC.1
MKHERLHLEQRTSICAAVVGSGREGSAAMSSWRSVSCCCAVRCDAPTCSRRAKTLSEDAAYGAKGQGASTFSQKEMRKTGR